MAKHACFARGGKDGVLAVLFYYIILSVKIQLYFSAQNYQFNSVCVKRNIVGRSPHHCEAHHLHEVQPRSFAPRGGNDVLASLEMMLRALHANDVVPTAQMEKSIAEAMDFLAEAVNFEPYA